MTEMNNQYRVYAIVTEKEESDRIKQERTRGCNGESHVDHLERVFYNADDEVVFAEQLATIEQGGCDNTCGTERRGGFLHPTTVKQG